MATAIHNRICLINLFITLTFCIENSSKTSLSDIKLMCGISSKHALKNIPKDTPCTAVLWYSSDKPKQEDIDALKKNLKRACIFNDEEYADWYYDLDKPKINKKVDKLSDMIDDKHIDILIFDYLYMPSHPKNINRGFYRDMQDRIYNLFTEIQIKKPNTLFGIMLRWNPDPGFDLPYLEKVVPFFVYMACGLGSCAYHKHQSDMKPEDPASDVEFFVKDIFPILNNSKVCLGIRLGVDSSTSSDSDLITDSYSTFCSKKPKKRRRFCVESLSNYYEKGKLVWKYKLAGSFINYYDYDDVGCNCNCGCNAATTAINAGVHGAPAPNLTKCTNWTLMYRERNNP